MQQVFSFFVNLNTKFERPFLGLMSHYTSMCSVVLTPHQLKIVQLRNKKSNFYEILTIYSTDVALHAMQRYLYQANPRTFWTDLVVVSLFVHTAAVFLKMLYFTLMFLKS